MSLEAATEGHASGFLRSRVVQVHPTLRCNLACSHCYSSSGPDAANELAPEALIDILARLRVEGYEVVSFSGGEPLVYSGFMQVAHAARELGYRVNLITNGLLLSPRRVEQLAGVLSRVGVSIDGSEPVHDRLRGSGTFARTTRRISHLADRGVAFGIAHCVSRESIPDLPWLLEYCIEQRASLLQLHPMATVGRAVGDDRRLRAPDLARLFLLARLFEVQAGDMLQIQLDLAPVEHVLANRERYRILNAESSDRLPLAELVNPVVLDEHGRLWPLAYGMASSQQIVCGPSDDWAGAIDEYVRSGATPLRRLLDAALDRLADQSGFIDWYAYLVDLSHALNPLRIAPEPAAV